MSYQSKIFCGVCHKAGKTESEYTSHYTKSEPGPKGIVTCPIIKNNQCNKCGKYGHFQDYCSYKKNHDLNSSNHHFEKPRKKIVLEPTYDELFPALGGTVSSPVVGMKRSRDNNQYNVLQNQLDCVEVKPVLSYKVMLEKEPAFVSSDSDSLSSFTDLHHYKKKYTSNHNSFIHHDVDVSISKRILPVEIDESLLIDDNDFSDDDENWDGSWY